MSKVIKFMKKSGHGTFRIFGGEPTLHSRFEEVYNTISKNNFSTVIFSNGVIPRQRIEFLKAQPNLRQIVVNTQHPSDYRPYQYEQFKFSLLRLGSLITLGFVVYKTNFDSTFIVDLIERYGLNRKVKVSIAAPLCGGKNSYIELKDHKKVIKRLVRQSSVFKRHGIRWYPDTTFMWCLFTQGQLAELYDNVRFSPINLCTPVLEVAPNLSVYRCYGAASLSNPKLKITDFGNEKEAFGYFARKEAPFKTLGVFAKCFRCDMRGQACGAGCIVHILQSLPKKDYGYIY